MRLSALFFLFALPMTGAAGLQWTAPPMSTTLAGKISTITRGAEDWQLMINEQTVSLSALPRFVKMQDWQGCLFDGLRQRTPSGATFSGAITCESGAQMAIGVNQPPDRLLKTGLNLRPVNGRIRISQGERTLLTLKSGQSGSVRTNSDLWCVHATFTPAPRLQGVDAESTDRLSWVLMRTSTARRCRD